MASRSFIIRLDVDRPDPENREFKHPDPFAWTIDNRARIMRALYTLLVWNPYLRTDASERPPAQTRFKRWHTLCGAPVEAVAKVDFAKILSTRESEDTEVSATSTLLQCFQGSFPNSFISDDVAKLADSLRLSNHATPCPSDLQPVLEEASGKPFPRKGMDPRSIGKKLQMLVGKPVAVDDYEVLRSRPWYTHFLVTGLLLSR
jgi:hypothetical protein